MFLKSFHVFERQRHRALLCADVIPQLSAAAETRGSELSLVSHVGVRDPVTWTFSRSLPECALAGMLGWKQGQDLNRGTLLWGTAIQVASEALVQWTLPCKTSFSAASVFA